MAPKSAVSLTAGSQFDLAILGADDPLGEAVLALLAEREVPIGKLHALALDETDATVGFRGEDWLVHDAREFDFSQTQALLVVSRAPAAIRLAEEVRVRHPAMPVLTLAELVPAPALVVSRVLKTLAALAGGVTSADVFVTLPVAVAGKAGVEELADQSRALFNLESPEPEAFPLQIAFNLIPYFSAAGSASYESVLAQATADLTGARAPGYSVVWAPLFHGAAACLHVRAAAMPDATALRGALRRQDGITLMETELPAGTPTPATDALGSEEVFIGRIQASEDAARFWLVFDPNALEAAQMVTIVENWIDKPASSVLT